MATKNGQSVLEYVLISALLTAAMFAVVKQINSKINVFGNKLTSPIAISGG